MHSQQNTLQGYWPDSGVVDNAQGAVTTSIARCLSPGRLPTNGLFGRNSSHTACRASCALLQLLPLLQPLQ